MGLTQVAGSALKSIAARIKRLEQDARLSSVHKIAQGFQARSQDCFAKKQTPEGVPWPPAKDGHADLLVETGAMKRGSDVRVVNAGQEIIFDPKDWKSGFHLVPYYNRGALVRAARRWIPLPGQLPPEWRRFANGVFSWKFWQTVKVRW